MQNEKTYRMTKSCIFPAKNRLWINHMGVSYCTRSLSSVAIWWPVSGTSLLGIMQSHYTLWAFFSYFEMLWYDVMSSSTFSHMIQLNAKKVIHPLHIPKNSGELQNVKHPLSKFWFRIRKLRVMVYWRWAFLPLQTVVHPWLLTISSWALFSRLLCVTPVSFACPCLCSLLFLFKQRF